MMRCETHQTRREIQLNNSTDEVMTTTRHIPCARVRSSEAAWQLIQSISAPCMLPMRMSIGSLPTADRTVSLPVDGLLLVFLGLPLLPCTSKAPLSTPQTVQVYHWRELYIIA